MAINTLSFFEEEALRRVGKASFRLFLSVCSVSLEKVHRLQQKGLDRRPVAFRAPNVKPTVKDSRLSVNKVTEFRLRER